MKNINFLNEFLGSSFRIPSVNEFLLRHALRKTSTNMLNIDACNSTSVPERHNAKYIDQDIDQDTNDDIDQDIEQDIEYSLDYETGLLKTSSIRCTTPSVPAASSKNYITTGRLN